MEFTVFTRRGKALPEALAATAETALQQGLTCPKNHLLRHPFVVAHGAHGGGTLLTARSYRDLELALDRAHTVWTGATTILNEAGFSYPFFAQNKAVEARGDENMDFRLVAPKYDGVRALVLFGAQHMYTIDVRHGVRFLGKTVFSGTPCLLDVEIVTAGAATVYIVVDVLMWSGQDVRALGIQERMAGIMASLGSVSTASTAWRVCEYAPMEPEKLAQALADWPADADVLAHGTIPTDGYLSVDAAAPYHSKGGVLKHKPLCRMSIDLHVSPTNLNLIDSSGALVPLQLNYEVIWPAGLQRATVSGTIVEFQPRAGKKLELVAQRVRHDKRTPNGVQVGLDILRRHVTQ